jgi:site-specific DNA-methyltransferase (adenine-specific)
MDILDNIYQGDSIELLKNIPNSEIDLILSDIPYGIGIDDWDVLHDNTNNAYLGSSPAQEKAGAVFKKRGKPLNGWSTESKDSF